MTRKPIPNEAELLIQVTRGNGDAFKKLYQHYSAGIYRVAYQHLHSPELAEDVVQEIFLAIWSKRAEFQGIRSFQAYLFSMTRNLCLKHMKDLANESEAHLEFLERINLGADDAMGPYHELLDQIVEQLPPQQKRIFELAKIQGLSHDAIARILNLSASTVNNHITAALKSIKLRLHNYIIGLFI